MHWCVPGFVLVQLKLGLSPEKGPLQTKFRKRGSDIGFHHQMAIAHDCVTSAHTHTRVCPPVRVCVRGAVPPQVLCGSTKALARQPAEMSVCCPNPAGAS